MQLFPELQSILEQLDAVDQELAVLLDDLTHAEAVWRSDEKSWSIAECLQHLALINRIYIVAMQEAAEAARKRKRFRKGRASPGLVGKWFVRSMEPPVKRRLPSPKTIVPDSAVQLDEAVQGFIASQQRIREFLFNYADLDLAGIKFRNPFLPGLRLRLITGLCVIPAHERRHLWQAQQIRKQFQRL